MPWGRCLECASMKLMAVIFTALLLASSQTDRLSDADTRIVMVYTDSEAATVGHDRIDPVIYDHYGNPSQFTHYIISVPKTRV